MPTPATGGRSRTDSGAAVVDFVLVLVVLVPLFLGILQVGLVLHVRNTLTAAASEGARFAATADRGAGGGGGADAEQIRGALADRYADRVTARAVEVGGVPGVRVEVRAEVPPLGLLGPGVPLRVAGHAVEEELP